MQNLVESSLHRLGTQMRYSGARVVQRENVAEHSFYVALLADLLAHDIETSNGVNIDRHSVLQMALYHDAEEAFTGDLITPVKNKSPNLRKEWDKLSEQMLKEGLTLDFPGHAHLTNYVLSVHSHYEEGKDTKLENQVVKFADGLQSIIYLLREVGFGNRHVLPILENVMESMSKRFSSHAILGNYMLDLTQVVELNLNISGKK